MDPETFATLREMNESSELPSTTLYWHEDIHVNQWMTWDSLVHWRSPRRSYVRQAMADKWSKVDPDWELKEKMLWLQKTRRKEGYYVYPLHPITRHPLLAGNNAIIATL